MVSSNQQLSKQLRTAKRTAYKLVIKSTVKWFCYVASSIFLLTSTALFFMCLIEFCWIRRNKNIDSIKLKFVSYQWQVLKILPDHSISRSFFFFKSFTCIFKRLEYFFKNKTIKFTDKGRHISSLQMHRAQPKYSIFLFYCLFAFSAWFWFSFIHRNKHDRFLF